jgi:hypothetical protein
MTQQIQRSQTMAFDAYERYVHALQEPDKSRNISNILRSLLLRRFIPKIGGICPKGNRSTAWEVQEGIEFLKKLPSNELVNAPTIIEQAFSDEEKEDRRKARSVIKQFIDQLKDWGYFDPTEQQDENNKLQQPQFNQFRRPAGKPRKDWKSQDKHYSNRYDRPKKKPYALMAMKAVNTRGVRQTEKVFPADYINEELEKDLQDFKEFRSARAKGTLKGEYAKIMQILGWLHRFQGIDLKDLRLSSIISHCDLIANLSAFLPPINTTDEMNEESTVEIIKSADPLAIHHFLLHKFTLKEKSEQIAQRDLKKIKKYLDWFGGVPISKVSYIGAVINVAHYKYQEEIGKDDYKKARDIPIIRELLSLKLEYEGDSKNFPESVPFYLRSIPWERCIGVVEKLRLRYEEKVTISRSKRYKKGFEKKKRTTYSLARDLQDFLSVAFMVLIPPDRSRTYYELELRRTFIFGWVEGRSVIPANDLKDPTAHWYIILRTTDFKTGKRYGLYIAPMPNTVFPDGKTLYMYIHDWLTWGRKSHSPVNHNYFFRGTSSCDPLNHCDWNIRITQLFEREANVSVPPKELRKIFISYLKSQKGSRAELEAATVAQHHSQKMQDEVYDYQEQLEKIKPIFDFSEKTINKVFQTSFPALETNRKVSSKDLEENEESQIKAYKSKLDELQGNFDINVETVNRILLDPNGNK